jgi:signal transduction histidine kinase
VTDGAAPAKVLRDAAHELNNLCATILGFATLAEEMESQNSAIASYLSEICLATEGVAAAARRLRDLSLELEKAGT